MVPTECEQQTKRLQRRLMINVNFTELIAIVDICISIGKNITCDRNFAAVLGQPKN